MEQGNESRRKKNRMSRKQRRRRKQVRSLLTVGSLMLTGLIFYFIGSSFAILNAGLKKAQSSENQNYEPVLSQKGEKIQTEKTNTDTPKKEDTSEQGQQEQQGQREENQEKNQQEQLAGEAMKLYQNQRGLLVLVNKERELPSDYDANLTSICNKRLKANANMKQDLTKMLNDGEKAGYSFWVASAWRSSKRQQTLLEAEVNKNIKKGMNSEAALNKSLKTVMPAGHSEHETGLALDILCSDNLNMDETQETAGGNIWLREHCAEYGFVLRYPKEKEEITQIAYEPWHFRYVGSEVAEFMTQNNLTLEEFYDLVEE